MKKDLKHILQKERIGAVKKRSPIFVEPKTSVRNVINLMKTKRRGCVLIKSRGKLMGIFTERDILIRVIGAQYSLDKPIGDIMTANPAMLSTESSVAEAIQMMSQGGVRHIPLVNKKGEVESFVSARNIVSYLSEHFPYEIYTMPPDLHQINSSAEGA